MDVFKVTDALCFLMTAGMATGLLGICRTGQSRQSIRLINGEENGFYGDKKANHWHKYSFRSNNIQN